MKLIYSYIRNFRNIREQEVRFSRDFNVRFASGSLSIERQEKDEVADYLYGNSLIKDMSVIVGKTGSGKTNLLQMIGMYEYDKNDSDERDSYFLLFWVEDENKFIVEYHGIRIDNLMEQLEIGDNRYGLIQFGPTESDSCFAEIKKLDVRDIEFTHMIMCAYDRNSLPYYNEDIVEEKALDGREDELPRISIPFGKSSSYAECMFIKEYVLGMPTDSLKKKVAFEIVCDNWKYKAVSSIDEETKERIYWTYSDEMFFKKKGGKKAKQVSPKKMFLHDLMMDYAIYMRQIVEAFYLERELQLSADQKGLNVMQRIEELCSFLDMYADGEIGPKGLVWQEGEDIKDIYNILNMMDDKYFTPTKFSIPIEEIDFSEGTPMYRLFENIDNYTPDDIGVFGKKLLPYHWANISSGEYQYAKVWGDVFQYSSVFKVAKRGDTYETAIYPHIILLIDEPETYMHPEMCRNFISKLDMLMKVRETGTGIQVIISTHSPFMLSDVLSDQVIKMSYDDKGYCIIDQDIKKPYFAANIYTIMADGFFLDYTIGECARYFIQEKYNQFTEMARRKDALSIEDKQEVNKMRKLLPHIGDDLIRHSFNNLLENLK